MSCYNDEVLNVGTYNNAYYIILPARLQIWALTFVDMLYKITQKYRCLKNEMSKIWKNVFSVYSVPNQTVNYPTPLQLLRADIR